MKKVIVVVGPTSVGKSDLGIKIAQHFNGEIISGDSIQVYKGLDIGSAKINEKEKQGVTHHLIDILDLDDNYNVCDFQKQARQLIEEISEKGKIPIIVGGTGLYIKALIYDYLFLSENNIDNEDEYADFSNEELYQKLQQVDYQSSLNIHVNNRKRIIRALQMSKNEMNKSTIIDSQKHEPIYDAKIIGLTMERSKLYKRINQRVDKMIDNGLEKEVTDLYNKDPKLFEKRGIQGIGYKEWEDYFNHRINKDEVIENIKTHSRQFAKRQYTWFNHQMPIEWYDIENNNYQNEIFEGIKEWL